MKKIILLILWLLPTVIFAQSDIDYFHTAANYYVNADKKNAKTTIQEGIRKFPDNQKLNTLASKIDQLPDPEDEQNQQNQNQDKNEQQDQQSASGSQDKQDTKRKLDALQMNERKTQEKANRLENQQTRPAKQEKDW